MDDPATDVATGGLTSTEAEELERQLRHASFFTQASLEQQGKLAGKLDVYVTSLIELLLDRGVIDAEALAKAVETNRAGQAAEQRARYETDGALPAWPTVMVREDPPPPEETSGTAGTDGNGRADGHGAGQGSANGNGNGQGAGQGSANGNGNGRTDVVTAPASAVADVEVDCDARMHICQAACCSLPFPLSAAEVESGKVKWDLGHPYVIRHSAEGFCVHNDRSTGSCGVYDHRPGVCRGYSCAEDDRIWLDFDNMVLNEEYLGNRRRPDFQFKPSTAEAVPVTITPRSSRRAPAEATAARPEASRS